MAIKRLKKNKLSKLNDLEYRRIIKFDKNNMPYEYILKNVPGVKVITEKLKELAQNGESDPIILAGDLAGMGELNNNYGREAADSIIEKALTIFINEFDSIDGTACSPSGDEIWAIPPDEIKIDELIDFTTKVIKKLNTSNYYTGKDIIGINAKFYIGRKSFADVESLLKYYPGTKNKLPPGSIVIEGSLLGREKDMVLQPKELSDEIIIQKTNKFTNKENNKESKSIGKKRFKENHQRIEEKGDPGIIGQILENNLDYAVYDNKFTYESVEIIDVLDRERIPLEVKYRKSGYFYFPEEKITSPNDIAFAFQQIKSEAVERFYTVGIQNDVPIFIEPVSIGTLSCALISPFEPLHLLLQKEADSFYLLHNHPSNMTDPSKEDENITQKFITAYDKHNIKFKGHLVMGYSQYSFINSELNINTYEIPEDLIAKKKVSQLVKYINWNKKPKEGFVIDNPYSLFEVSKSLQKGLDNCAMVVYLNNRLNPISSELIPHEQLSVEHIAESCVGVRSMYVCIANTKYKWHEYSKLQKELNKYPIVLLDAIDFKDSSTYISAKQENYIEDITKQYYSIKDKFNSFKNERLNAVRNSILIKKTMQGYIDDNDPLIDELKSIQKREELASGSTRRLNEQGPREKKYSEAERESLRINNEEILNLTVIKKPVHEFYKNEMKDTTRELLNNKVLNLEEKKEVADLLNSDSKEAKKIWNKKALSSAGRVVAVMYLNDELKDKINFSCIEPQERRIITDIKRDLEKTNSYESTR